MSSLQLCNADQLKLGWISQQECRCWEQVGALFRDSAARAVETLTWDDEVRCSPFAFTQTIESWPQASKGWVYRYTFRSLSCPLAVIFQQRAGLDVLVVLHKQGCINQPQSLRARTCCEPPLTPISSTLYVAQYASVFSPVMDNSALHNLYSKPMFSASTGSSVPCSCESCSVAHKVKNVWLPEYKITWIFRIVQLTERAHSSGHSLFPV